MKQIETATINNNTLAVLIEWNDSDEKAYVDYFINGYHVTDWSKIKPIFQTILTAIANDLCNTHKLIKWSY
jgi:hypothetical protein